MNKKIYMFLLSAAVIAASGSVVWAAGETEATENEADASGENQTKGQSETDLKELTEKLAEENTLNKYVKKYGSVILEQKNYDDAGNAQDAHLYADAERLVIEASGDIQILDNTDEPQWFGFRADLEKPFKYYYIDNTAFQKVLSANRDQERFVYTGEEQLITDETTEEGRKLVLETTAETLKQSGLGEEIKDGEIQREEYLIDPETFAALEYKAFIVSADGSERLLYEDKVTPKAVKYELDKAIAEKIESQDTRTLKLVLDPGTENEQEYSAKVAKDCAGSALLPAGYDALYDDEECTQRHQSPKEFDGDVVLYSKYKTEEDILKELGTVNAIDRLVEDYGSIGVNGTDYQEDGEIESYFYADAGRYAWENSTTGQIDIWDIQGENMVGYDAEAQIPMEAVSIDKAMLVEAAEANRMSGTFIYADGEKIISDQSTAAGRVITTEITAEYLDPADTLVLAEGEICRTEYLLDPETLFVKKLKIDAVSSDGKERPLRKQVMTAGAEKYELPAEYQALLDGEDTRTFTVVTDPGTEQEQTVSKEIARGCGGLMIIPEGYQVYDDKECTKLHESTNDFNSDQTVYLAKPEK